MQITKKIYVGVLACFFSSMAWGTPNSESSEIVHINVPMTEIGHLLETTLPLVYDDKKFLNPSNEKSIKSKLKELEAKFKSAEPHLKQKSVAYKVSSDVFLDQIASARQAFQNDEKKLSQHILKGIPGVCMSCHMNDNRSNALFHELDIEKFNSNFDKAEFSFITRDYEEALKYYNKALNEKHIGEVLQLKALERMLIIYSEIYQKPESIYEKLKAYRTKNQLPNTVRVSLDAWLQGLEEYMTQSGIEEGAINYKKLDTYMNKQYQRIESQMIPTMTEEKDKIFYIMLRSSLHAYLNNNPSKEEIPALLYWLAVCDKTLEYHFYYSFADWYLRECIKSYSKSPFAKQCYQAYNDYLTFSYTGSRGTELPEDIQAELDYLKSLIDHKKES